MDIVWGKKDKNFWIESEDFISIDSHKICSK